MITDTAGHTSLPDPEAILRVGRRAKRLAQKKQQKERRNSGVATNIQMEAEPTMGSYCRRTDGDQVTQGFQPLNPVTFDIKGNVLSGLRENQFDGRINSDPWDHLSQFAETCEIQKVPEGVTEDQKKLRLFAYSLAGPAKDWLRCLPRGTIATWKDLEDKFLERFFTHSLFQKRRSDILSFKQHETESLCEAYERFKLLMRKCPNHSISAMEQMQIFVAGMKMHHKMILDASAGGSIKNKTEAATRELVEQMCQNEYNMNQDRVAKSGGKFEVDREIALKVEIELLKKQLSEAKKDVKAIRNEGLCDYCLEDHPLGECLPRGHRTEELNYMGNQRSNPYPTNPGWNRYSNQNQGGAPQPRKPSPLEELMTKFVGQSQANYENMLGIVTNQSANIKSMEHQIGQLSKTMATLSTNHAGTTVDNPKEECKVLKTKRQEDEDELESFRKWFKTMGVNLEEAYDAFMGEIEDARDEVALAAEFIKVMEERTPEKKQDPGSLIINCYIGEAVVKALCDIGSSVNVMPLSLARAFNMKEPTEGTARELTLADQSTIYSKGNIEDIQVRITDLEFPVDFMILDVEEDKEHPIILGRPFLATAKAIIDMGEGELTLKKDGETRIIQLFNSWNEECYKLEWKKKVEPRTSGKVWRIKVELHELGDEVEQLTEETCTIKEVPQDVQHKLERLAIEVDVKAPWVTTWGRARKVAKKTKPQLGVNTTQVKNKPVKKEGDKKEGAVSEAPKEEGKRTYPTH
jgi:hypothetical protein